MLSRNYFLHHRYRIIRPLSEGGFGRVYEAIDDKLDCLVAVKERHARRDSEKMRRAFEREAKLLANLRHPFLPKVSDHFFEGEGQYLVMEFIEGDDLAMLLRKRQRAMLYEEVMPWADAVLSALEYLHGRNEPIIHRDIKPANIKVTDEGEVFLLDFGLAKGYAGEMPMPGQSRRSSSVHGYTAAYAPLEQLNNSGTNSQSDLYSLGGTLYQLLTNHVPVVASQRYEDLEMGRSDSLPTAHEFNPKVPLPISRVLSHAMAMSRRDRVRSASEMRQSLRDGLQEIELERQEAETACLRRESPPSASQSLSSAGGLGAAEFSDVVPTRPSPTILSPTFPSPMHPSEPPLRSREQPGSGHPLHSWPSDVRSEGDDPQWTSTVVDSELYEGEDFTLVESDHAGMESRGTDTKFEVEREEESVRQRIEAEASAEETRAAEETRHQMEAEAKRAGEERLRLEQKERERIEAEAAAAAVMLARAAEEKRLQEEAHAKRIEYERLCREKEERERLEAEAAEVAVRAAEEKRQQEEAEAKRVEDERLRRQQEERERLESAAAAREAEEKRVEDERLRREQDERERLETEAAEAAARAAEDKRHRVEVEVRRFEDERVRREQEERERLETEAAEATANAAAEKRQHDEADANRNKRLGSNGPYPLQEESLGVEVKTAELVDEEREAAGLQRPLPSDVNQRQGNRPAHHIQGNDQVQATTHTVIDSSQLFSTLVDSPSPRESGSQKRQIIAGILVLIVLCMIAALIVYYQRAVRNAAIGPPSPHELVLVRQEIQPGKVWSVAFSPDGTEFASAGGDLEPNSPVAKHAEVAIWDARTWKKSKLVDTQQGVINSIAYSPDGQRIASGSSDNTIRLWNRMPPEKSVTLGGRNGHHERVLLVAFSPDGTLLVSAGADSTFKLWAVQTGELIWTQKEAQQVWSIAFSRDGTALASGAGKEISLWDIKTRSLVRTMAADRTNFLMFSPSGEILAAAQSDGRISLWNWKFGKLLGTLTENISGYVTSLAFTPDGQTLASGGADKSIKLWDVGSGKLIQTLNQPKAIVDTLTYSPDGRTLVGGMRDRTIMIWQ